MGRQPGRGPQAAGQPETGLGLPCVKMTGTDTHPRGTGPGPAGLRAPNLKTPYRPERHLSAHHPAPARCTRGDIRGREHAHPPRRGRHPNAAPSRPAGSRPPHTQAREGQALCPEHDSPPEGEGPPEGKPQGESGPRVRGSEGRYSKRDTPRGPLLSLPLTRHHGGHPAGGRALHRFHARGLVPSPKNSTRLKINILILELQQQAPEVEGGPKHGTGWKCTRRRRRHRGPQSAPRSGGEGQMHTHRTSNPRGRRAGETHRERPAREVGGDQGTRPQEDGPRPGPAWGRRTPRAQRPRARDLRGLLIMSLGEAAQRPAHLSTLLGLGPLRTHRDRHWRARQMSPPPEKWEPPWQADPHPRGTGRGPAGSGRYTQGALST